MNSNEEIVSSLCDRIMAVCNRINKRLDENDQFHSSYDGHPNLALPYVTSRCPQTGHQLWQTEDDATNHCVGELRLLPPPEPGPPYALPAFANHADHPMDWQQLQVRDLRPPDVAPPYDMTHRFSHHQDRHQPQPTLLYQQRHPPVVNTGFHPSHAQPPDHLEWQQLYYDQNFATSASGQPQPELPSLPYQSERYPPHEHPWSATALGPHTYPNLDPITLQGSSSYDQPPARQSSYWDSPAHRAPQAYLTYAQLPPHAAITPSTAANPLPDSHNLVGEDEEVVQKSSGNALWSNQSKTILGDEDYGQGMANDDMLESWRLKSNDSSPTKSSRDEHANDGELENSSASYFSSYGYIDRELVEKEADTDAASVIEEDPVASLGDEEVAAVQEQVNQIKAREEELETFELKIVHMKNRTGFEEDKNFHVVLNSIIAGRFHVIEYLGSVTFSTTIPAHDLHTGIDVCVKIIKNQDIFCQSFDDITLLDTDARLIPPRMETPCLSIHGCADKLPILSLNYSKPKGSSLVNFDGDDEGRRPSILCVFDPGGFLDAHRCFVVPTLRTRWISTVGELIRSYLYHILLFILLLS